jgi:hypothetical protein
MGELQRFATHLLSTAKVGWKPTEGRKLDRFYYILTTAIMAMGTLKNQPDIVI